MDDFAAMTRSARVTGLATAMRSSTGRVPLAALAFAGAVVAALAGARPVAAVDFVFAPNPAAGEAKAAGPPGGLQLILDDGTAEGAVGVSDTEARQFLWFNRFTPDVPPPFLLEEIQVLFPVKRLLHGDGLTKERFRLHEVAHLVEDRAHVEV